MTATPTKSTTTKSRSGRVEGRFHPLDGGLQLQQCPLDGVCLPADAVARLPALAAPITADSTGLDPSFRGPGAIDDASPQHRPQLLSAFVGIPAWYWGYGASPPASAAVSTSRFCMTGSCPTPNDSIGLEFGADFIGIGSSVFGGLIGIPIEALWAFHFTPKLAAYFKLGIALEVRFGSWCWGGGASRVCGGAVTAGAIADLGIWYKISDAVYLRVEVGYPGLKLGLGFPLL